ncbi:MAG: phosphate acyltransferase, partial [Myxococcales bacterium]
ALHLARPRVALLSNGEEASKGTEVTRAALEALTRSRLDFAGYIEGKDLFAGEVDVVVTDGFTGNVVLKTSEGAAAALGAMLKREIENHSTAKLGALLMAPAFAAFKKIVDYAEYGGAPLVGIDGVGVLAHGRSTPRAFMSALRSASEAARAGLSRELSEAAASAKALMQVRAASTAG